MMIHQNCAPYQKTYVVKNISDLNNGISFASSLLKQGGFSAICIALISIGEKTGMLEDSLNLINQQLKNEEALQRQMKQL